MKYISYGDYMKEKYGEKIYKVSLSISSSCPNRDGTKGRGGCIFCSQRGSGDFAGDIDMSVSRQIDDGISLVNGKGAEKFVAYFQSFTSTYIHADVLREKLNEAADHPKIVEISVATRPDCLGEDIMEALREVGDRCPLSVELGLQTMWDVSAKRINRGYFTHEYAAAVKKLKDQGISVVAHVILGLPWETKKQMIDTAEYVGNSGADGIKLQLLHIIRGTKLGNEYENSPFEIMGMEEYISLVGECLKVLPEGMIIHRLTGDGTKKDLIAPLWSSDKKRVMNAMRKYIESI